MVTLSVKGRANGLEYLRDDVISPTPLALIGGSEGYTLEMIKKNKDAPIHDPFPLVSKEQAEDILREHLEKRDDVNYADSEFEYQGYSTAYAYYEGDNNYHLLYSNMGGACHQFRTEEGETVWIGIDNGGVVDDDLLEYFRENLFEKVEDISPVNEIDDDELGYTDDLDDSEDEERTLSSEEIFEGIINRKREIEEEFGIELEGEIEKVEEIREFEEDV